MLTITLIIANVIFSLLGFYNRDWTNKNIMWPYRVKREGQFYRFISSGFLHADFMHLFFNMFTLYYFGNNIEIIFDFYGLGGTFAYSLLYFSALVFSDLPSYFKHVNDPGYRSLGASGAVSAVVFASVIFGPWQAVYLYGALKISFLIFAILYIYYCIYMGKKGFDNVNHDAHLWGALFGFVYAILLVSLFNRGLWPAILEEFRHPSLWGR
jgi:membrane associated rhomboid family serine protease